MNSISIIAGELKGKKIPFNSNKFKANITSQKVKGAVFSMLGEYLYSKTFLDLFACSGQIGLEALSRGAELVVFNERDKKRYQFIKDYVSQIHYEKKIMLLNVSASRIPSILQEKNIQIDYIYIDPPYRKNDTIVSVYYTLMKLIEDSHILRQDGSIIIQHFKKSKLDDSIGIFQKQITKIYGTTVLSLYR